MAATRISFGLLIFAAALLAACSSDASDLENRLAEMEGRLRAAQVVDDDDLKDGIITPTEWRKARGDRNDARGNEVAGILGQDPLESDPASPDFMGRPSTGAGSRVGSSGMGIDSLLRRYYQATQQHLLRGTEVDWDAVEAWKIDILTPEEQGFLRDWLGEHPPATETEQEYLRAFVALAAAGFFDVQDRLWDAWQQDRPGFQQWDSYNDWLMAAARELREDDRTIRSLAIAIHRAEQLPFVSEWTESLFSWNTRWDQDHPTVAPLSREWGFTSRNLPGVFEPKPAPSRIIVRGGPTAPTPPTPPRGPVITPR